MLRSKSVPIAQNIIRTKGVRFAVSSLLSRHGFQTSSKIAEAAARSPSSFSRGMQNDRKLVVYGALGGLAVTFVGGLKYVHNHVGGMEGLARTVSFYSLAIPKYLEYRMHMLMESPQETWDRLDEETSKIGLQKILELRGFYIKSGQMCAANIGNAFPKIWQDTMSVLQDACPAKDYAIVKGIIESEYGKPIESVFSSFEKNPIGAASIGQVHKATLRGSGDPVVVKVMYPEVEQLFRGDVRTIKMFCEVAQPVHVPPLEEIEKQFMTEFDYIQEAEQLGQVRDNLTRAGIAGGESKLCVVPKPYKELCTKRVLVMEELKGVKLAVGLQNDIENHAFRAGKSVEQFKKEEEEKIWTLKGKGNLANGPNANEYEKYIRFLNGKRQISNAWKFLYNYSLGLLPGFEWKNYENRKTLPINHAQIMDELIYIHGHEVLVDGYFNGDPHPGNILLLGIEKQKPQLGLIDYGQVKKLEKGDRLLLCKVIIALANDDRKETVRLMKEAGYRSKTMDEDTIFAFAKVSYDEDNNELTGGKHIQLFMEHLQSRDPIEKVPEQYIMVGRTSIMLRGLAHALNQSRSIAKCWKSIAESVLDKEEK